MDAVMDRRSAVETLSIDFVVPTALILSLQRLIGSKFDSCFIRDQYVLAGRT